MQERCSDRSTIDLNDRARLGGWLATIVRDLVAAESTNPGTGEAAVRERIEAWLAPSGLALRRVETLPGRHSLAAVLEGTGDGPHFVLNGHMDTVPLDDVERWTAAPFGGELRDGWIYGRGACDMKAGLAVQIVVARALAAAPDVFRGTLVCHFAIGEERGEPGTTSLLEAGFGGDAAIVLEPTGCRVATASRGLAHLRVTIGGRGGHASRTPREDNPVWQLPAVLAAVDAYARMCASRRHRLLPSPTCTPTILRGGVQSNSVADAVELIVDRRLLPGEDPREERERLAGFVARHVAGARHEIVVELLPGAFPPAEAPGATRVAHLLAAALEAQDAIPPQPPCGVPYASDVGHLAAAGIEAVTFGPGSIDDCHCVDERVPLAEIVTAARAVGHVARELLV